MSDAFAQINALLAAAAAQQQKQQPQSSQNQNQNQNQNQQQSSLQTMNELQKQQQLLQQFNNQFNNNNPTFNTNSSQNPNQNTGPSSASALLNHPNMLGLNEQSLQALLYSQSIQKNNSNNNNLNQNQRNLNNMLQNNSNNMNNNSNSNNNNQQSFLKDFGQTSLIEDRFRESNNFFHGSNESQFHSINQNQRQQQQQQHKQLQNEPPQTRVLEPYFSDDSPLNSIEHQLGMANMHRENTANQIDIMNEFQKISLNDSLNNRTRNDSINQKINNSNLNNSHHNTSSNFDNSMFSLNDSNIDIYSADQNYMPGTASLIEDVDKQIMVVLRDGRTLIGYLRSIDQYANLLLSSTFERIHVGKKYGDIPKGIYIVRGENVVLIGEVDFKLPVKIEMTKVEIKEILELQKEEQKAQENEKNQKKALLEKCQISNTDAVLDEYY